MTSTSAFLPVLSHPLSNFNTMSIYRLWTFICSLPADSPASALARLLTFRKAMLDRATIDACASDYVGAPEELYKYLLAWQRGGSRFHPILKPPATKDFQRTSILELSLALQGLLDKDTIAKISRQVTPTWAMPAGGGDPAPSTPEETADSASTKILAVSAYFLASRSMPHARRGARAAAASDKGVKANAASEVLVKFQDALRASVFSLVITVDEDRPVVALTAEDDGLLRMLSRIDWHDTSIHVRYRDGRGITDLTPRRARYICQDALQKSDTHAKCLLSTTNG